MSSKSVEKKAVGSSSSKPPKMSSLASSSSSATDANAPRSVKPKSVKSKIAATSSSSASAGSGSGSGLGPSREVGASGEDAVTDGMFEYMLTVQRERRDREAEDLALRIRSMYGGASETRHSTITMELIAKQCLDARVRSRDSDRIAESLLSLTHLRLDRLGITRIENLDLFSNCTHLQLQVNHITRIEGLEFLPRLRFLVLSQNKIRRIENIVFLDELQYLDLSDNALEAVDAMELPSAKLAYVNFKGNKACDPACYRSEIVRTLPLVREIDEEPVTNKDRADAEVDLLVQDDEEEEGEGEGEEEEEGGGESQPEAKDGSGKVVRGPADYDFIEALRKEIDDSVANVTARMAVRRDELVSRLAEFRVSTMLEFEKRVKILDEQREFLQATTQALHSMSIQSLPLPQSHSSNSSIDAPSSNSRPQ
eukprot:ANDGO_06235.mRNA.1 Dynein regulatory complex subunit 3